MLNDLTISGFRCFRELRVPRLTRVNLFVGTNNAGKTSILEAAEILAAGTLGAVFRSCIRRGEIRAVGEAERKSPTGNPDPSHLFYGHRFQVGASFSLQASGEPPRKLMCSLIESEVENGIAPDTESLPRLRVESPRGDWFYSISPERSKVLGEPTLPSANVSFIGTERPGVAALRKLWEAVVLKPEEEWVLAAMRIIEPRMERIAFVDERAFVKLPEAEERLPMGNLGDGLKQLMVLALHLVSAKGGFLLVDEIDTGLHHTIMVDMWKLIIETAKRLDIQVLATTHSLDCVRALAWVQDQSPELASEVTLHRIEKDAPETVVYSMDELAVAARHHLEVR